MVPEPPGRPGAAAPRRARAVGPSVLGRQERLYVAISMQSFKRGMPLLPALEHEEAAAEIDAGQRYGLRRWVRYEPVPRA